MEPHLWTVLVVLHAVGYSYFVVKRGEGGWAWSLVVSLLLGPLVWFAWLAGRAGRRRAEEAIRRD